ncbi:hypothetical protein BJ944DRAFT_284463 [Cunninghamella echinulata]|nr:hypothetical protein BJ944DRAFT_284463 [Cunninghamella echinulata]
MKLSLVCATLLCATGTIYSQPIEARGGAMDAFGIVTGLFGVIVGSKSFIPDASDSQTVVNYGTGYMDSKSTFIPDTYTFNKDNHEMGRVTGQEGMGENSWAKTYVKTNKGNVNMVQVAPTTTKDNKSGETKKWNGCFTDIAVHVNAGDKKAYIPIGHVFDLCGLKTGDSSMAGELQDGQTIYKKCALIGPDYGINDFRINLDYWTLAKDKDFNTHDICNSVFINAGDSRNW